MDRLDRLQLNRATLDRQLLLRRAARPAAEAIGHLAGLQAQAPLAPYVGLWTRLAGFGHQDLEDLLTERIVVRAHLMRNTVHLVTATDYARFRPLFQPLMERTLAGSFGQRLSGVDLAELRVVLVLRYLGAYGPATVRDIQAWSGLSRLREVTVRLGARLRTFTGPDGAELYDLPDAPRPGADVPAPPRFLPEYDNLLLSFADRSRVIRGTRRVPLPAGHGATTGTVLVEGFWAAGWTIARGRDRAVLEVRPFGPLGVAGQDAVAAEGRRLLEFAAPAGAHDVRFCAAS